MPVVRTDYAPGAEIPDCIQKDLNSTLSYPVYRDDALVAVTQAGSSFSLRRPDGTMLISNRAITVVGGEPQVTVTAADLSNEPYQMGVQVRMDLDHCGRYLQLPQRGRCSSLRADLADFGPQPDRAAQQD